MRDIGPRQVSIRWARRLGLGRPRIFVSYRRADSGGHAGRLFDGLRADYGSGALFLDHDTIRGGEDFTAALQQAMDDANIVLAVIGPDWAGSADGGSRRIDDPDDWVRREVVGALDRKDLLVVPVLVGGAPPPDEAWLPEPLRPLVP